MADQEFTKEQTDQAFKDLAAQKKLAASIEMTNLKELVQLKDETLYFEVFFDDKLRKYLDGDVTPQSKAWAFVTEDKKNVYLAKEIFTDKMAALNKEATQELLAKYVAALDTFTTDEDSFALFYSADKDQMDVKLMTAVKTLAVTKYW